ncbi:hypothetical protein GCM10010831_23970 [Psychroflexus salis]|uniref:Secretion system C-terminal sorting domain-containing protein n=2 Tax=Psychroflexus salis TaxID=1526574 RepID=A0A917A1A0_9FLAO|nr:hypothetical protein GCM10010831_23970 [Psychroflexus salis]
MSILVSICYAQTPGLIYKPSSTDLGSSILDPNGDGFVSPTTNGFSVTDSGVGSELKMISLPVFESEPLNDISTGSGGGHTDIASAGGSESCYILKRTVNGIDYLIIRFRLGGASTASKGYSLLIDSDGVFGTALSSSNLGFDREIVYETGNNGRIAIYKHEQGAAGTLIASYNVNAYSQRSVALSTAGGNPDYFYDFFVPLEDIDAPDPVRFTAVTVTSAGSGVLGTISDFNGINDKLYGNNLLLIQQLLINSFPAVSFENLDENFEASNWLVKTNHPTINAGVTPSSNSISGFSTEADGTLIEVFKNAISLGTTTVSSNTWSISITGLEAGDIINATANASGKNSSDLSANVVVANAQSCFTSKPTNLQRGNQQTITGDWSQEGVDPSGNVVSIQLYEQNITTNAITIRDDSPNHTVFVQSDGTWSMSLADNQNNFNNKSYLFKAIIIANNCTSAFSNVSTKTNGGAGTITFAPDITTSTLSDVATEQQVSVINQDAAAANLFLYVNGLEIQTSATTVASNTSYSFTVSGLAGDDVITARAQVPSEEYWLSNVSNQISVTLSDPQASSIPTITGTYVAGSGIGITGTSLEASGTLITVFKNGVEIGTATVSAFGTWELTGQTLVAGNSLTATAKATSKSVSESSNSVSVIASLPSSPTLNGPISVGDTSVSGGGIDGNTIIILVDADPIGTATVGADNEWSLENIDLNYLYKGAEVTAIVVNNNVESEPSNAEIVSGVSDFSFTLADGSVIPSNLISGETIEIKITAQDCASTPCTTATNFNSSISLASNAIISPLGETANFSSGELTLSLTIGGSGTVRILGTNPNDPTATGEFQIEVSPATWVGGTSTDFNTASNWLTNSVPGNGADIVFDANVLNNCALNNNITLNTIDFNSGSHSYSIDLNEKELSLRGTLVNHTQQKPLLASGEAKLNLLSSSQTFTVYFEENSSLENLVINANASEITLGSELRVTNTVELKQGTFNTSDLLVFAVTLPQTDDDVAKEASFFYESGTLNGEVIVEKYYPVKRAFRMVASPVNGASIFSNWQNGGNYEPGFHTHITGEVGTVGHHNPSTGIDYTTSGNKSLYLFDNGWQEVLNTKNTNLQVGFPYRLMVRGDRSTTNISSNTGSNNTIIRSKGTLVLGNQSLFPPTATTTTTGGGNPNHFSLLANPYQATIDVSSILFRPANLDKANNNAFYVWDPMINNRGAFVTVDNLENGGQPVNSNSSASNLIEPGQAFFIQANTNNPNINFTESMKVIPSATIVDKPVAFSTNEMSVLFELHNDEAQIIDAIRLRFAEDADNGIDALDAFKMVNLDENLASVNENSLFTIQRRSLPENNEVISLFTNNWRNDNYSFTANLNNLGDTEVYLVDNYLATETLLTDGEAYSFSVDANIIESVSSLRFALRFDNETMSVEEQEKTFFHLYPNPVTDVVNIQTSLALGSQVKVELYNMLGQLLSSQTKIIMQTNLSLGVMHLEAGVYLVKLTDQDGHSQTQELIKQ